MGLKMLLKSALTLLVFLQQYNASEFTATTENYFKMTGDGSQSNERAKGTGSVTHMCVLAICPPLTL